MQKKYYVEDLNKSIAMVTINIQHFMIFCNELCHLQCGLVHLVNLRTLEIQQILI